VLLLLFLQCLKDGICCKDQSADESQSFSKEYGCTKSGVVMGVYGTLAVGCAIPALIFFFAHLTEWSVSIDNSDMTITFFYLQTKHRTEHSVCNKIILFGIFALNLHAHMPAYMSTHSHMHTCTHIHAYAYTELANNYLKLKKIGEYLSI
jgi:hypothetical protein